MVLGALALSVVALASYVLVGNTIEQRKSDLASVTTQHESAVRQAAALKPYATFQEVAAKRVQTVQALASLRFDWDQALADVSRALPADVTLASLDGSLSAAGGGSGARAAVSAPAIELKGCVPSHNDVATLMSRLRTVRGVTRVALSKSAKEPAPAPLAVPSGGKPQGPPCGKDSAPTFELVAFFERAQVPAPATPGAPAAAPAAPGAATTPATTPAPGATTPPAGQSSTTTPASTTGTTTP